ncbi:hypothetical protein E8E14_012723 [Neopestalotiopsis sp. 37M]|nr:hypothetical protein E8E14_012723 [Neopestalotiopsis sp. 37M]
MLFLLSVLFATLLIDTVASYADIGIGVGVTFEDTTNAAINASGLVLFPGYNVSQPFPGTLIDGWSLELDVMADVPASVRQEGKTGFATIENIYVTRPQSVIDDSWRICAAWLGRVEVSEDDDGSCSSALDQDCLDGLSARLRNDNARRGRCGLPGAIPEACGDRLGPMSMGTGTLSFNKTGGIGDRELLVTSVEDGASSVHQQGNYSAYDSTSKKAHLLALSFMSTDTNETAGSITLACVKANITAEGSRVPSSANALLSASTLSLALGVFLAFGVLFMV